LAESKSYKIESQPHVLDGGAIPNQPAEEILVMNYELNCRPEGNSLAIPAESPSSSVLALSHSVAGAFPRSQLRDGTELDYLRPDRPLKGSLWERSDLSPIDPPTVGSHAYAACESVVRQLLQYSKLVDCASAQGFPDFAAKKFAPYFGLKRNGTFGPKLAKHRVYDPIDPVVIFKEAVPLVHRVLLNDPHGNDGLDLDGMAYIIERLTEAKQLQGPESDIRFAVLEALSLFLSVVLAKALQEELA
jgi:hypothetical protein